MRETSEAWRAKLDAAEKAGDVRGVASALTLLRRRLFRLSVFDSVVVPSNWAEQVDAAGEARDAALLHKCVSELYDAVVWNGEVRRPLPTAARLCERRD